MSDTGPRTAATSAKRSPRRLLGLVAAGLLLAPHPAPAQAPTWAETASPGPLASELANEFDGGSRRERELRSFYQQRDWQPLWLDHGALSPAAEAVLGLVENADADGLNRKALRVSDLAANLRRAQRDSSPRALARAEASLSRTFAAYVQGTRTARGSGMTYHSSLLEPVVPTIPAALAAAAAAPSLTRYVADLAWMHPLYAELRTALVHSDLDRTRQRLVWLNLERARGLPANPAPRYVLIDAAGARLWMYEGGQPVDSMKVVVGKPDQPTPMVAGLLTNAVLNPYWNVPVDLVRSRIATNVLDKGLPYLRKGGYQVLSDFGDHPRLVNPAKVDWRAVAAGRTELRVRQLPGKGNFMGNMKFNFPNPEGIYLHDTPDKALLQKEVRTASSGCVRLEDAPRLGRWLFGKALVAKPRIAEQVVPLDQPVPVYITYLTAAPANGTIVFRDDVYQRDPAQWALLSQ
jgi:murein L,D-transpeptidase YcbB/YkuD